MLGGRDAFHFNLPAKLRNHPFAHMKQTWPYQTKPQNPGPESYPRPEPKFWKEEGAEYTVKELLAHQEHGKETFLTLMRGMHRYEGD